MQAYTDSSLWGGMHNAQTAQIQLLHLLQVWVYEDGGQDGESNIYVHHDIMLPAFPLCLAWMDCRPSGDAEPANLAAVGAMNPGIEIW